MKKNVSVHYDINGETEVDIFELMDEYLSNEELLHYMDEYREIELKNIADDFSGIKNKLSTTKIEELIQEIITWPEFIPILLDMHFKDVIDINALHQEIHRTEKKSE